MSPGMAPRSSNMASRLGMILSRPAPATSRTRNQIRSKSHNTDPSYSSFNSPASDSPANPTNSNRQDTPASAAESKSDTSQKEGQKEGQKDKQTKSVSQTDEEVRQKLEAMSGEGGEAGLELENGKPVAMKRSVRENMFRLI
ncbi:MAG: hypothetical protein M4579_002008 [Chaenotheca gracillima]|nr:MAG: hypothetical protein M4579_002008 [Chaenotheca gracillima]